MCVYQAHSGELGHWSQQQLFCTIGRCFMAVCQFRCFCDKQSHKKGLFLITEHFIFVSFLRIHLNNLKSSNCIFPNPLTVPVLGGLLRLPAKSSLPTTPASLTNSGCYSLHGCLTHFIVGCYLLVHMSPLSDYSSLTVDRLRSW